MINAKQAREEADKVNAEMRESRILAINERINIMKDNGCYSAMLSDNEYLNISTFELKYYKDLGYVFKTSFDGVTSIC